MPTSNFSFLRNEFPHLLEPIAKAEEYVHSDPQAGGIKLRIFLEQLVDVMYADSGLKLPLENTLYNRTKALESDGLLPGDVFQIVTQLRKAGNRATHGHVPTTPEIMHGLRRAFRLAKWFHETYAERVLAVNQLPFVAPVYEDPDAVIKTLRADYSELADQLEQAQSQLAAEAPPAAAFAQLDRRTRASRAAKRIEWSEEDTRELIDEQLRAAGWEVDTQQLNYKTNRTLPERGRMMAIAEWPCGRRWADYALFIGLELYGIVEAKKYGTDVYSDLTQAKHYAEEPSVPEELRQLAATTSAVDGTPLPDPKPVLTGQWGDYRVPFVFSTNGRPYLRQLETKSGIWFLDARQRYGISRVLVDWYSPEGLQQLYEQNISESEQKLNELDYDYLQSESGLWLRDYQVEAIREFEKVLINEPERRRALLTMATGTGKTRTAIGLCHRLIKTDRFRRILFLVDRRVLAEQAFGNFEENRVENLNTFSDIYEVKDLTDKIPDVDTRLHFATVQSLVRRLFHGEEDGEVLPVDTYDMIIVDEAHRGYNEDGELSDDELLFKNEQDYVSQYRRVLDYFDAFALGLTATPALHTSNIFGSAVFTYSYRQAVLEGHLIDHETPTTIQTRLNQEGITWEVGDRPQAYDPETNSIQELEALEDELHIEVEGFNRLVMTENFNKTVVEFLADHLDPDSAEKTLIFTVRQSHAELVAKLLKEAFVNNGLQIHDDAIKVITGKTDKVRQEIKKFRNEAYPNIAITVDLLTTGVDVPRICNLVFIRRVGSRILYEQMVGRATRTCDEIGKEVFYIYDAVRLYESIGELTQMRPVVTRPNETFTQLAEEFPAIPTEQAARTQVQQLLAKMQRKQRGFSDADAVAFRERSEGRSPQQLAEYLLNAEDGDLGEIVPKLASLWRWLDTQRAARGPMLVSDHEDELLGATAAFGAGQGPADYLESFRSFVENNQNKIAALNVICTRPRDLDRASLKSLQLALEDAGFRERDLNAANKATTDQAIAADIIAHIRSAALGSALISHETRVANAMKKIREGRTFNKNQENWLARFEKQLLAEKVLRREDLDKAPFSEFGGFERLDKAFKGELGSIIEGLNAGMYLEVG